MESTFRSGSFVLGLSAPSPVVILHHNLRCFLLVGFGHFFREALGFFGFWSGFGSLTDGEAGESADHDIFP